MLSNKSKLKIAMVVFTKIEPLDHYGPYRALSRMEQKGKAELQIVIRSLINSGMTVVEVR